MEIVNHNKELYKFFNSSNKKELPDNEAPLSKHGILFEKRIPIWKRVFDIIGACFGLIACAPLLLVIGILIKSISPGPILFRQSRIGRGCKPFECIKFRTMKTNVETNIHQDYLGDLIKSSHDNGSPGKPMEKLMNDPRIFKYGNFLRASGLDELPQLINVFLGQMSLIGPRPPIPYEVENYPQWYMKRFDVAPGLTGLWQVSGKNKLGFNEMIRLDIKYATKLSFFLDCKILFMTPFVVYMQLKEMKNNK